MRITRLILISLTFAINSVANISYINISKITKDAKLVNTFNHIIEDKHYFDHWTHKWQYYTSKQDLIKELKDSYSEFSAIPNKNEELYLLIGDIGYYLFNLDESSFADTATAYYELAIKANPIDYRPHWFLGNHYTFSNHSLMAIDNYLKAESLLPANPPADFWNDYAGAAWMANMPSHCIYAMDKVKSISGNEGSFEAQLGDVVYKKLINVDKDSMYNNHSMWSESTGNKMTFVSRPLGIKILLDSGWRFNISDYADHQSAFNVKPSPIKNKDGNEINYTIGIIMRTANDTEKLESFLGKFVSKFTNKTKINFDKKYDKTIAYEIKDPTMYPNIGGGHFYMIGIEQEAPKYPGLLLESPASIPNNKPGQEIQVYRAQENKKRFDGKIFYIIMLDSCEDIHEQSYSVFKTFFDNQIIIE